MVFETIVLENSNIQLIDGDRGKNYPKHTDFNQMGHCLFLSAKNVTVNGFEFSDTTYISKEKDEQLRAGKLVRGDIVLTTRGTIGNVGLYDDQIKQEHIRVNSGMMIFRPDPKVWNSRFLYFVLTSDFVKNQIYSLTTGSAVPQLPAKDLKKFLLPKVEKEYQDKIVAHISCVVDKITLNRQINQTLEQMAQTLFKSWFVDFDPVIDNALDAGNDIPDTLQERAEQRRLLRAKADFKSLPAETRALFPSEFEETELGWVPKGWANYPLSDLIELIGGGTPKTSIDEYWNGSIPWFSVVDAPNDSDVFVLDTEKHISELGLTNSSTRLLRKGTTIISARGTVGKCAVVATPMAMNQSCYGVIGVAGIADEYIYYLIRYSVQQLQLRSHGSVFSTITRDTFKSLQIPFCGNDLTACFSQIVVPLFDKILSNNIQNTKLIELRDALLPKLISGELALDDLPEDVAEVAEAV